MGSAFIAILSYNVQSEAAYCSTCQLSDLLVIILYGRAEVIIKAENKRLDNSVGLRYGLLEALNWRWKAIRSSECDNV